jgi:hypothetical protein
VQLKGNGTDNNQQSAFTYVVRNTGSSALSNITVRIYFTPDGSQAASNYVLEKYWDQSGAATVSGPTQSGSFYYFTVNYGATSLAVGGSWEFQTAMHLNDWSSNFLSTNDWWHSPGSLPASYTDWTYVPAYLNGSLSWGSEPVISATPTPIPTPVLNCASVRDSFSGVKNPIKLSGNTMYLDVPNTNPYPITVDHIYLAWNYKGGHNSPFNADLRLIGAQFPTGNVFWTGNIHAPIYTIPYPYSPSVVIPANATSRLTFIFDQSYDISKKEEVEIYFSTPGCEAYPVVVKN